MLSSLLAFSVVARCQLKVSVNSKIHDIASPTTYSTRPELAAHGTAPIDMSTFDTQQTHNNLPIVKIHHPSGSQLLVYLFGAHVFSFTNSASQELFFVSKSAIFDGTTPIRGGIPLVFPQFGGGTLPSHGFARRSNWTIHSMQENTLILSLSDNDSTRTVWDDNRFTLLYSITLEANNAVTTSLQVTNQGQTAFNFQALLHTYFQLRDITTTKVVGLAGHTFLDKLSNKVMSEETKAMEFVPVVLPNTLPLTFDKEIDYVFCDAPGQVTVTGLALNSRRQEGGVGVGTDAGAAVGAAAGAAAATGTVETTTGGSCLDATKGSGDGTVQIDITVTGGTGKHDIVVWNPWVEKSIRMSDFSDDEYKTMCCVEPGYVNQWETLEPNNTWTISQTLKVVEVSSGSGSISNKSGETKL